MRLAGCLTVPSKPTKTTRQGLAAKARQQAQEQLRHGQGAASQGAPPLDPSAKARRAKSDRKGTEQGRSEGTVPSKPTKKTRQGLAAKARAPSARPKRSGTTCKKGPKKSRKLRLAGCLTLPSKPTKKTCQGLAAKALQQAQEQLRHGQGTASQGAPPLDPSPVARRAKSDGKGTEQGRLEGA